MRPPRKTPVLVGGDSADWRIIDPLIDSGAMPGLARTIERGMSGNLGMSNIVKTAIATNHGAIHVIDAVRPPE